MHILFLLLIITVQTHAAPVPIVISDPCLGQSKKIKAVKDADQLERKDWMKLKPKEWQQAARRDKERREKIAQIFADGCFKTADDYSNAALVFQHGSVPDHFFQAYLWAQRAMELGKESAKSLVAAAIDRYLMDKGYKQIYATQAQASAETHDCNCLWPVEESSTDEDRRKLNRPSLVEQLRWVDQINKGNPFCGPAVICSVDAKPVPHGSLPGVAW